MPTNPISGRQIASASGSNSLSFVSAVVPFEVLLTNVDCVVYDWTVTLLKNHEAKENPKYT